MARKPTDYVQFKLRIRRALLLKIQREAEKKKHSANSEAVNRLEDSFDRSDQARRDSAIIDMLVDNNQVSGALLRQIAIEMSKAPNAFDSEADLKTFLTSINFSAYGKEIQERIKSGEFPEDQPEGDER
jgi:Arc-like DNA binding domain